MFDTIKRVLITDKELLSKLENIYNSDWNSGEIYDYEFHSLSRTGYNHRLVIELADKFYGTYTEDDLEGNMSDFEDLEWVEVKPVKVEAVVWENV